MTGAAVNPTAGSLLGFLTYGPMTGWDLDQLVEWSIGNFWNVTRSQIYRELRALAERGLVEVGETGARDRRPYTITPAGEEAFRAWLAADPGTETIRSRLLLTVFFGSLLPKERLAEILARARNQHAGELARYQELRPNIEAGDPFQLATLKFGIAYEEAFLAWLDEVAEALQ